MTDSIEEKVQRLINEERVKKTLDNPPMEHWEVEGDTRTHTVSIRTDKGDIQCPCKGFQYSKEDRCSHVLAVRRKREEPLKSPDRIW